MQITEAEFDRFFDHVEFRNVTIPSTGEACEMPLVGRSAIQMLSFHAADRGAVLDVLPSPSMLPVITDDGRTVIGVVAIEYAERNIAPYNEIIVVIPVRLHGENPPTIADLVSEGLGGCTLLVRHIAVNTRLAEIVGNEILGYAKFIAHIDFIDLPDQRICVCSEGGQDLFRLSVGVGTEVGPFERNQLSVCTAKDGKLFQLSYANQVRYATDAPDRNVLVLGDHPIGRALHALGIDETPLVARYAPTFQLISDDRNLEVASLKTAE